MSASPVVFGILNITEDSFSDGAKYLAPEAADARAQELISAGADVLDLGAAASNPSAKPVSADVEIERLAPVVALLKTQGAPVSVDSFSTEVQRWAIAQDVEYINDVAGFPHAEIYPELAGARAKLVVMHSVQGGPATPRIHVPPGDILDRVLMFFEGRLRALESAGIARERLIVDPGMGIFLSTDPEASFAMLRAIGRLKAAFGLPVLFSVSRKSFLRRFLDRGPHEAGAATLAAEMFAVRQGADYIRTHDPRALKDALAVTRLLDGPVALA